MLTIAGFIPAFSHKSYPNKAKGKPIHLTKLCLTYIVMKILRKKENCPGFFCECFCGCYNNRTFGNLTVFVSLITVSQILMVYIVRVTTLYIIILVSYPLLKEKNAKMQRILIFDNFCEINARNFFFNLLIFALKLATTVQLAFKLYKRILQNFASTCIRFCLMRMWHKQISKIQFTSQVATLHFT